MRFFNNQIKLQKFLEFKTLIMKQVFSNKTYNKREKARFKTLKKKQKFPKIIYQTVRHISLQTFQHLVHQKGLAKLI